MKRRKAIAGGIRYPVLTYGQRVAAAWAGFQDGRKQLPYGEVAADRLPPSCAVLHAQYASLLSRIEAEYRRAEAGFATPLAQACEAHLATTPSVDPHAAGPAGRAANRENRARSSRISAGRSAADELRALHEQAMADYTCAWSLAGQALAVYTRHLYRWHPQGTDLSARNWAPPGLPLPDERVGLRADLRDLLERLDE